MIDPAAALVVAGSAAKRPDPALQAARIAAGLLAVALHAMLLWGWIRVSRWQPESPPARFEVIFVNQRIQPERAIPPMPVPPARPIRKVASPRPDRAQGPRLQAVEVPRGERPEPPSTPSLRLWRPDGRLEMPDRRDEVPAFDDRARISRDRQVALPGSTDAAYAETVALRLRRSYTPEDVVLAVFRMLTGGAQPDDCSKIEARLLASDPDVVREIDLHKFRRSCR